MLDGFPRTVAQAEALDGLVDDRAPLVVVDIEVPEETLVERLSDAADLRHVRLDRRRRARRSARRAAGRSCSGATTTPDVVRERLRVYARDTQPLVEYYRRRPTFRSVDGDQAQDRGGGRHRGGRRVGDGRRA